MKYSKHPKNHIYTISVKMDGISVYSRSDIFIERFDLSELTEVFKLYPVDTTLYCYE